jgi:hypothetical protein
VLSVYRDGGRDDAIMLLRVSRCVLLKGHR